MQCGRSLVYLLVILQKKWPPGTNITVSVFYVYLFNCSSQRQSATLEYLLTVFFSFVFYAFLIDVFKFQYNLRFIIMNNCLHYVCSYNVKTKEKVWQGGMVLKHFVGKSSFLYI